MTAGRIDHSPRSGENYKYLQVSWGLMFSLNPFAGTALEALFDSIVPDFLLAFTFFTAASYAVLGRQFGRERPAAAMSVAFGAALAVGLVWWEQAKDVSIRDLGPLAVGFALLMLAAVVYAALHRVGGNWAGVAAACGTGLLIAVLFGMPWPIKARFVVWTALALLLVGLLAFLLHHRVELGHVRSAPAEIVSVRHDLGDLRQDRGVAEHLAGSLHQLRTEADFLPRRPDLAGDFMVQVRRLLPEEGWLTQRLAQLREKAHYARAGHVARIDELRAHLDELPPTARAKLGQELAARYAELQLDQRLERLDRAVAEVERRIRGLTAEAEVCAAQHDYPRVQGLLDDAAKLQDHNAKLLQIIERTEARLLKVARELAAQTDGVSGG
jgi:hypothetical protein